MLDCNGKKSISVVKNQNVILKHCDFAASNNVRTRPTTDFKGNMVFCLVVALHLAQPSEVEKCVGLDQNARKWCLHTYYITRMKAALKVPLD